MGNEQFNANEAACLLLGSKLYSDYAEASSVCPYMEAEHFAEEWMKRNIPFNSSTMSTTIWRYFMYRLMERKNGRPNA